MQKLLGMFVGAIVLTLVVGGGVFAYKNKGLLVEQIKPKIESLIKKPAGSEAPSLAMNLNKETFTQTQETATKVIGPLANKFGAVLGESVSSVASGASTTQGTYNVNMLFENAKSQASEIPEKVFNQARYTYCKQVVEDYEKN